MCDGKPCGVGAVADDAYDAIDRTCIALHECLNCAVVAIAHPTDDAGFTRDVDHREPKSHSLHATANHQALRDHKRGVLIRAAGPSQGAIWFRFGGSVAA